MGGGLKGPRRFGDLKLRAATKNDLDAIAQVVTASFPDDPGCNYKYPFRHKYPKDFWVSTRAEYEAYLDQSEKFAVLLVTKPVVGDDEVVITQVVAVGVWDVAVELLPNGQDCSASSRRDVEANHVKAYTQTMSASFRKYFAQYGHKQIHLWMLYTHPDFRRQGAGTMLCQWGLETAMERGCWTMTLMASPMGRLLYRQLAYTQVGTEKVQVDGEEARVHVYIMEKKNE